MVEFFRGKLLCYFEVIETAGWKLRFMFVKDKNEEAFKIEIIDLEDFEDKINQDL